MPGSLHGWKRDISFGFSGEFGFLPIVHGAWQGGVVNDVVV
jgi:hypothetical protein